MKEEAEADVLPARVLADGPSRPETLEHAQRAVFCSDLEERGEIAESMAHAATLPLQERASLGHAHCQRCEVVPRKVEGPGTLYLNLPHTHTLGKSMRWLRGSGLAYTEDAGVIAIAVPQGSLAPVVGPLSDLLSPTERAHTRVAFQPGSQSLRLVDMFAIEDIATFAARAEADWLLDLLRESRFASWFQPIVRCADAGLFGYECLLRGVRDDGVVPPGPIFATARRADLQFQTDMAGRRSAIVSAAGAGIEETIFVNFSPNAIYDAAHCLDSTVRLVDELGIAPERVVFEVTETDRLPDVEHLASILDYYRNKGFGVALDDVGSGFSGLQTLLYLRPDYVKIDLELVRDVHRDPRKAILTGKLIETAQELGSKTVFEGVETEDEWIWARERGVDYAQGYYFGKPAPEPRQPS